MVAFMEILMMLNIVCGRLLMPFVLILIVTIIVCLWRRK